MRPAACPPRRLALAACLAVPLAAALLYRLGRPYPFSADQDLVFVYEALRLGQGLPQQYLDHTGYLCFLLLSLWFKALNAVGLVAVARLDQLPPDGPTFHAALQGLTVAGRVWSAALATGLVLVMHAGLRRLAGNPRLALAATAAFATSEGLLGHALIMRTELLAALAVFAAFFLLLAWIRAPGRPGLAAALGLAAAAALMAKMQTILLLLAFPVLALAFGERRAVRADGDDTVTALWLLVAAVAALPAGAMVATSIIGSGGYQAAIAIYAGLAMPAYARLYRLPGEIAWRGAAALALGLSSGMLLHLVRHNIGATTALVNFVEHMSVFTTLPMPGNPTAGTLAAGLADRAVAALAVMPVREHLAVLLALGLATWHWWSGERRLALRTALLAGVGLGFVAACSLRGYVAHYRLFAEGWWLLAIVLGAAGLPRRGRDAVAAVLLLLAASQGPALFDGSLLRAQAADNACIQAGYMSIRDAVCR
jgi:hypothetical protein